MRGPFPTAYWTGFAVVLAILVVAPLVLPPSGSASSPRF